jgi:hypothetical protein
MREIRCFIPKDISIMEGAPDRDRDIRTGREPGRPAGP